MACIEDLSLKSGIVFASAGYPSGAAGPAPTHITVSHFGVPDIFPGFSEPMVNFFLEPSFLEDECL